MIGACRIFARDHGLRIGNLAQAIHALRLQIGHGFPGPIRVVIVEDGEGASGCSLARQNQVLGRFRERHEAETGRLRHARADQARRLDDLRSSQWSQCVRRALRRGRIYEKEP